MLELRCGTGCAGQAPRARALPAATSPRCRAGALLAPRGPRAARSPRDARRRVDAGPRLRLATAAGCERARQAAAALPARRRCRRRTWRRCPAGPVRPRGAPWTSPGVRAIAAKIAPLPLAARRRRAAAGQPPDPDDRPRPLLRRLHRQVQPRRRRSPTRFPRPDRDRRPGRDAAAVLERTVESYSGLAGVFERVEVAFGRESPALEVSRARSLRRDHLVDRSHRGGGDTGGSEASASCT